MNIQWYPGLYAATAVVLVSVLMGVLPFVLAYQVIAPLVMGAELDASFLILRVALVLVCLVLQAVLYGWGLNLSHKAAYDTLLRLRTALQKRFEKLPLGVIQDKGTGTAPPTWPLPLPRPEPRSWWSQTGPPTISWRKPSPTGLPRRPFP